MHPCPKADLDAVNFPPLRPGTGHMRSSPLPAHLRANNASAPAFTPAMIIPRLEECDIESAGRKKGKKEIARGDMI